MEFKQTGWLISAFIVIPILFITGLLLLSEMKPEEKQILILIIPALLIPLLLFYRLVVVADRNDIRIKFGIGLIRKRWNIADIDSVKVVRNNILQGWGIHVTSTASIYNVNGFDAIEISFKGKNRRVRIGTNEPEKLAGYLNELIVRNRKIS